MNRDRDPFGYRGRYSLEEARIALEVIEQELADAENKAAALRSRRDDLRRIVAPVAEVVPLEEVRTARSAQPSLEEKRHRLYHRWLRRRPDGTRHKLRRAYAENPEISRADLKEKADVSDWHARYFIAGAKCHFLDDFLEDS